MIDWNQPVQTRSGGDAVVHTTSGKGCQPVIGEYERVIGGEWETGDWAIDGQWDEASTGEHDFDLVNVPHKHTMWVNVYSRDAGEGLNFHGFYGRLFADQSASNCRVACIQVTFTEGEGLAETDTSE